MNGRRIIGARGRLGWLAWGIGAFGLAAAGARTLGGPRDAIADTAVVASAPAATAEVAGARALSRAFAQVASQVRPAVVTIRIEKQAAPSRGPHGIMPWFFEGPQRGPQRGVGSGVIIDHQGHIVTNQHVVDGAREVKVVLHDGRELSGKVVGVDEKSDIAVVRVEGIGRVQPAAFGDSDRLEVGEWVLALGAPFDLDQTVTAGIVSAKGRRKVRPQDFAYEDYVQTDAAVNPGNSGGPLVNLDGQVVGVNTMIATPTGSFAGISFAVSANVAKRVAHALIAEGRVRRPYIGVSLQELSAELRSNLGVTAGGALVAQVFPQSPAEKGGLLPGDVILTVEGQPVTGQDSVVRTVQSLPIGHRLGMEVQRSQKRLKVQVVSAELPEDSASLVRTALGGGDYGLALQDLTPEIAQHIGVRAQKGALIADVRPGSPAAKAGLSAGDVIVEIDRRAVTSSDEATRTLRGGKGTHVLRVIGPRGSRYLTLSK